MVEPIARIEGEDQLPNLDLPSYGIVGLFAGRSGWTSLDPNATTTDPLNAFFATDNW